VRDAKALQPEDVLILYFERHGPETRVHPISIDKYGNLVNAPKSYRDFFLAEEKRFLGL
jgi:hypothetical protein